MNSASAAPRQRSVLARIFASCAALLLVLPSLMADSRTEFLQLLDRPRVPLDPELAGATTSDRLIRTPFNFAAEAGVRVPGIMIKLATMNGPRPVVIAMHGTGGNKETQIEYMERLARAGFLAVAIDGRYHGARSKAGTGSVEYIDAILQAFRDGKQKPFFFDTAWDIMRLVDYLETRKDVDPKRIGLFGISKGGIEAYLAAAADTRIAVVVPCIAVESFSWAVDHDSWHSRIGTVKAAFDTAAKETGVKNPGAEFVRTFYSRVAPGIDGKFDGPAMVPLIAPRPLLSINGEIDPRTPLPGVELCAEAARAAYRDAGAEDRFVLRIQPKTAHKVNPDSFDAALAWFERWLKP
jgi:predicted esterase